MKKINDLKSERSEIIEKMEVLTKSESLTEEQRSEWSNHDSRIKAIDDEISLLERQEELNKSKINIKNMEHTSEKPKHIGESFRDFLVNAVEKRGETKFELRADPILTSTDSDMITKTVNPGIDILTSPGEAFLRQLGVTFFTGLNGNFAIPSMAEDTATFPGEDASAASANMLPDSLVLAARRVTHTQKISRETLAQTNPGVYSSILQNLVNGVWNAVTNDVFDTLETDGASRIGNFGGGPITYTDLVNMEASIAGLNIGTGAYVTTPSVKAFLKKTAYLSNQDAIWQDNEVNGYPAYGVPAANTDKVYFGDFGKCAVGQWGGLEIVVDPYSDAKKGLIDLTIIGLFDTGCYNPRGLVIMNDASVV